MKSPPCSAKVAWVRFYRARDTKLKRDVAIKVLAKEFSGHEDRVSRFQREAEVLASLSHPNIAAIYDLQEGGGIKYLVLELVEGERSPIGLRWNLLATAYGLPSRRNYSPAFDCQPESLQDHARWQYHTIGRVYTSHRQWNSRSPI